MRNYSFLCALSGILLSMGACGKPHSGTVNGIVTTGAICADFKHHPGSLTEPKLNGPGGIKLPDPVDTIDERLGWNITELGDHDKADIIDALKKPENGIFYFRGHGVGTSGSVNNWLYDEDEGDGTFAGLAMNRSGKDVLNAGDMGLVSHSYVLAFINCCFSGGDPDVGGIQAALSKGGTKCVYMGWNTKVARVISHYYASFFFNELDSGKTIADAADAAYRSCINDQPAYMTNRPSVVKRGKLDISIDRKP